MSFERNKKKPKIGFCPENLVFLSVLLVHGTVVSQTEANPASHFSDWLNRLYRPQIAPQSWISVGGEDLLRNSAHFDRDSYQAAQVSNTNVYKPPNQDRSLSVNVNVQYPNEFDPQSPESLTELRVPGLLENVDGGESFGRGPSSYAGSSDGSFGRSPGGSPGGSFGGPSSGGPFGGSSSRSFGTQVPVRPAPPLPDIQIGDPPPRNQFGPYRIEDNFQQSFQVLLMPQSHWATQYRNIQGKAFSDEIGGGGNEGSIITANRIYFSPPTPYRRSQPFRKSRPLPPLRRPYNGLSAEEQTKILIHNISNAVQDRNIFLANADKTIAVVHLQSYSALSPDRDMIRNDSDILEAQESYGFAGNNFKFGSTSTIVSVFKKLLNTNFDGFEGRSQDIGEGIGRIQNFVNATQKIHFWAHGQGESDAMRLFKFTRRLTNDTDPTFTDTAPITDTLSAVVF